MGGKKIVAFDIFGTCFGFTNVIEALDREFGDVIKKAGTTPAHVFMAWFYAVQRDFTYLTAAGTYTAMPKVWKATLPRALAIALNPDVEYPSTSLASSFDSTKLDGVVSELSKLPARPGLNNCYKTLWEAGYDIYAVSNGAKSGTKILLNQVDFEKPVFTGADAENFIVSCDDVKKAKPFLDIYELTLKQAGADPSKDDCWFVAAHTWDLHAAKQVGFKTAFVTYEEIVTCEEIYSKPDVIEDGLAKLAKAIVGRI